MSVLECVLDAKADVGECPMWHQGEQRLYWVDASAGSIHRFNPETGENESRLLSQPCGSFGFREKGGLVGAFKDGFGFLDFESGTLEVTAPVEAERPDTCFNDGRVGPGGHFYAGTMGSPIRLDKLDHAFYRFDPDGRITKLVDGMGTSNGLAFSPDGKTLYHSDSLPVVRTIWAWDHDPTTGAIANRRVFVDTHHMPGRPDGGCVDAEGFYWSALVDGWQVARFDPDGKLERVLSIPVQKPSMPCFGGPDLDTLFVTSIGNGGTVPMAPDQPLAGGIFACQPGMKGLPEPMFSG
ncbi:MAG: SMP-30/gluconolactonase/LRE family protein [Alphaproteobacteria bacterium]